MQIKPRVEAIPQNQGATRVILADVGLNARRGINWEAPLIQSWGIHSLPCYYVVDGSGKVTSGDAARNQVAELMAGK